MARNKLAVVKYKGRFDPKKGIKQLLKQLGMPRSVWGVRNFWEHFHGQFDILLHDAKVLYKTHARRIHPRRSDDAQEESTNLNAVWTEIQRRIKQHTCPSIWMSGRQAVPRPDVSKVKAPPGYYVRVCAYDCCHRVFFAKNKRQKFCHRLHMHYQCTRNYYRRQGSRRKPRKLHKCALKSCGALFWNTHGRTRFCRRRCKIRFHNDAYYRRNSKRKNAHDLQVRRNRKEQEALALRVPGVPPTAGNATSLQLSVQHPSLEGG